MNPEQNRIDVQDVSDKPKRLKVNFKSKKLKVIALALALVILVGGAVSAMVVHNMYNKPENVVATAMGKYLLDGKDKKFDATVEVGLAKPALGISSVELKMNVETTGKTSQVDLEANLSVLRLRGSVQSNENGSVYIQLKDLQALLSSGLANGYGVTDEMKQQIEGLDSKWVEITKEDMATLTGKEAGTSAYDKCMNGVYALMGNDKLGDEVDKIYRSNRFFVAKSATDEVVAGKKLLKVEVGLDKAKGESFSKALIEVAEVKDLAGKCGISGSDESTASSTSDGIKNGKLTLWLDRGKKELVKLEASGDSYSEDGNKDGDVKLTMDIDKPSGKLEAPKDVVNIKDLMQTFGIDLSSLSPQ